MRRISHIFKWILFHYLLCTNISSTYFFSLVGNNLPDSSCIQFASVIKNNWSLKILSLSNNRLYGPNFSDLMEALSSPTCRIEELQ
ncbi:hypothetical protein GDO81_030068 [Engystomops pustulosus]|uniref:Uncharacterized protein n=1 Tax=Engystomops pustulosus TaxID=76066 RepID=A0AAV6YM14_ENGPU|nr:hypothetical protein GDO81_030068 [Engystomops pustulosus]